MDIKIINSNENILDISAKGDFLLEKRLHEGMGDFEYDYRLYDSGRNTLKLICPEILKSDAVPVFEASVFDDYVHFVSLEDSSEKSKTIILYRYKISENSCEPIISLNVEKESFNKNLKIKIFIFSLTGIIVQYETITDYKSPEMMGHIVFTQKFYDLESNVVLDIKVEDFINNGINKIFPLSDSEVMLKTGYSYLEDSRFTARSEEEAVIESIFIVNIARFISDLLLGTPSIEMELVHSVYYDRYILNEKCTGEFIYFDVFDPLKGESESIFYNYKTKVNYSCKNLNMSGKDFNTKLIIGNTPHVLRQRGFVNEFLNLETQEFDLMIEDEDLIYSNEKLMITRSLKKNRQRGYSIFTLPSLNFSGAFKGAYLGCCVNKNTVYIYCKK